MKKVVLLVLLLLSVCNVYSDDQTTESCRSYILNNTTGEKTCVGQYIEEEVVPAKQEKPKELPIYDEPPVTTGAGFFPNTEK